MINYREVMASKGIALPASPEYSRIPRNRAYKDIPIPDSYRELEEGERIQEGDRFMRNSGFWRDTTIYDKGFPYESTSFALMIRLI